MKVVGLHGIGHTFLGGPQVEATWLPALASGLQEAGGPQLKPEDFRAVGYGAVFRPPGERSGAQELAVKDLTEWEQDMLLAWWREAAHLSAENRARGGDDPKGEEPTLQGPEFVGRARTPSIIQRALEQITRSRFFRAIGPRRLLLSELRQVRLFLHDPTIKSSVLVRVSSVVTPETRVLVGHSLGSVVAYEALCANIQWKVHTLVTLGSPLGIPELVFDQLTPRPTQGKGTWPNVQRWVNIADKGDIVALEKSLAPYFPAPTQSSLVDVLVYNGWEAHSAERYLAARETGRAIAEGLAHED